MTHNMHSIISSLASVRLTPFMTGRFTLSMKRLNSILPTKIGVVLEGVAHGRSFNPRADWCKRAEPRQDWNRDEEADRQTIGGGTCFKMEGQKNSCMYMVSCDFIPAGKSVTCTCIMPLA